MSAEWSSLIRKEWQERRLSLAICAGWILCCLVYVLAYEWTHPFRTPVARFYQVATMYAIFASVFLAMKTALGEATQGTLNFSLSLPVTRECLAGVRLAGGILTLVVPIVLGAVLLTPVVGTGLLEQVAARDMTQYVQLPQRPSRPAGEAVGMLWTVTAIAVAGGTQMLLILALLGARRTSEAQIGFCGAVLAFFWLWLPSTRMMLPGATGWIGAAFPVALAINWGYGAAEGSYTDLEMGQPVWMPLAISLVVQVFLAWWFTFRYGTRTRKSAAARPRWWQRRPALWSRLPVWLPNETAALVWINLRQSVSMACWGLVLAAALTFLTIMTETDIDFRSQLPGIQWFVGALWAAVVGVGVFAAELQPGLSRFWRSRPISAATWFWCKYFVGLAAVLLVLDATTIIYSWGTEIDYTSGLSRSYIACVPILHVVFYSVAVLGICRLRMPILGGVLAIGGYLVATILLSSIVGESYDPIEVHNNLLGDEFQRDRFDLTDHHYPLVYGTLVLIAAASAWLAYRAIRSPEGTALLWRRGRAAIR